MKARGQVAYVAEPPVAYLSRPPVVVDCSILAAIVFDEASRDAASQLISGRSLHAPWLLEHEIASVADKKRRAGVTAAAVDAGVRSFEEYDIRMHRARPTEVVALAASYALTTYDAAYLAVAARLRVPLVTFDHKLGSAAARHLGSLP